MGLNRWEVGQGRYQHHVVDSDVRLASRAHADCTRTDKANKAAGADCTCVQVLKLVGLRPAKVMARTVSELRAEVHADLVLEVIKHLRACLRLRNREAHVGNQLRVECCRRAGVNERDRDDV